jgi:hypothetical protein
VLRPYDDDRQYLPIMKTFITNIIRLQIDLEDHVKGQCETRDARKGTRIIIQEIVDISTMTSYLEKNNLHYFTFFPNSEEPLKVVVLRTHERTLFSTALRT